MLYNMDQISYDRIVMYWFEIKRDWRKDSLLYARVVIKTLTEFIHLKLLFWRVRKRHVQKCVSHVQHDLLITNNIIFAVSFAVAVVVS